MGGKARSERPNFSGYWKIVKHDNLDLFLKVLASQFPYLPGFPH